MSTKFRSRKFIIVCATMTIVCVFNAIDYIADIVLAIRGSQFHIETLSEEHTFKLLAACLGAYVGGNLIAKILDRKSEQS